MTALPAALGALHWLMEIVKYSLSVEENELTDMLYRNDKKQEVNYVIGNSALIHFMIFVIHFNVNCLSLVHV